MKLEMMKIRRWVATNMGIDAGRLSDKDVVSVAEYMLSAMSIEVPRISAMHRKELGLEKTE